MQFPSTHFQKMFLVTTHCSSSGSSKSITVVDHILECTANKSNKLIHNHQMDCKNMCPINDTASGAHQEQ